MILFKRLLFGAAALTLISVTAVLLAGCSDGVMLSDEELAEVLTKSLGDTVEIIEAPEGKSDGEYSMKCADGTEFTVKRMQLCYDYFGADRYYQYECDYLLKWVSDHSEVNALFDERGIAHNDFARGTRAVAGSFEEIHSVVETACELVESGSYRIPAVTDLDRDYKVKFARPVIAIDCLSGNSDETTWLWEEFEYQDGTEPVDHDEELQVFLAEQRYVDEMRDGDILDDTHQYLLEMYGPSQMIAKLNNSEYSMIRAKYPDEDISVGKTETLYYVRDGFDNKPGEELGFPHIATFAECTGFSKVGADSSSFSLARGDEKVVFHFSDSGSYAERNGVRVELRGNLSLTDTSCMMDLTTDDLTKLFDTEFQFDYINGTAGIANLNA